MRPERRRAGRAIRKRRRWRKQIVAYSRMLGAELLPWQVEWLELTHPRIGRRRD